MRALIVTNMFPTVKRPFYGIFVKDQVDSLQKEGVIIDLVYINGVEERKNYFKSIGTLYRKMKSNDYDIIHAHHSYCVYPILLARKIAKKITPIVLTFREGEIHRSQGFEPQKSDLIKKLRSSKTIKSFALNKSNFVIAVEKALLDEIRYKKKYEVILSGVNLQNFRPLSKDMCREKLNLPLDKRIIYFPASPERKNKGFDLLETAVKHINDKSIYIKAGGSISHEDVPYYMCAADVVVQLSDYEASPMTLKEAMAVNVPVVFTRAGDVESIAGNVKGCFLCERNIEDIVEKICMALDYGKPSEGRSRILEKGLGLDAVAKKVILCYQKCIDTCN